MVFNTEGWEGVRANPLSPLWIRHWIYLTYPVPTRGKKNKQPHVLPRTNKNGMLEEKWRHGYLKVRHNDL